MKTLYTRFKRPGRATRQIVFSGMLSLCGLAALLAPLKSSGQVYTFSASGNATNPVTASVSFQTSGPTHDLLNIVLCSTSKTLSRSDVLDTVYFGVNYTPTTLAYVAATGTVIPDPAGPDQPNTDLVADSTHKNGKWAFATFGALNNTAPGSNGLGLEYGLGTAGNSNVTNGGFPGSIVSGDNYALVGPTTVKTDIGGAIPLVRGCISFQLSGFAGHTVQQIDSVMVTWNSTGQYQAPGVFDPSRSTPEPGTWAMLCGISVG
ncbi:MAG: XDD4 family exosortase-dependent surface protein, partial [Chthonomonadales bacterium]